MARVYIYLYLYAQLYFHSDLNTFHAFITNKTEVVLKCQSSLFEVTFLNQNNILLKGESDLIIRILLG